MEPSIAVGGARCIAVLGVGEAGYAIAAHLVALGVVVRAYDPVPIDPPAGAIRCTDEADAARGADVVLSVNSAADAEQALLAGTPGVTVGAVWADLNTASAQLKARLARIGDERGVDVVDVALMTPVPGQGLRTPMLVSGVQAERFRRLLTPLGASITVQDGPPGAAATRKLLRSTFYKGMAAAVVEALAAARAAGCEDWLRTMIGRELEQAGAATVDRLEEGSRRHARRRAEEMRAAADLLTDLGVPPRVARAAADWLDDLTAQPTP